MQALAQDVNYSNIFDNKPKIPIEQARQKILKTLILGQVKLKLKQRDEIKLQEDNM